MLGFTRETVIALTTNIESREWKRREYAFSGHSQEHPRASSTDDVECLFSIMRDLSGKHFTVRLARYNWRKICIEFSKRLNPGQSTTDFMKESVHHLTSLQVQNKNTENNEFVRKSYCHSWCMEGSLFPLLEPGLSGCSIIMFQLTSHLLPLHTTLCWNTHMRNFLVKS